MLPFYWKRKRKRKRADTRGPNPIKLLILVHLAGVATDWLLKGDNLVRAMVTGDKNLTGDALGSAGTIAPLWRAIVVAGIAGGVVWAVMSLP